MIEVKTREEARRATKADLFGIAVEACMRHATLRRRIAAIEMEIRRFIPTALDAPHSALVDSLCNIQIDLSSMLGHSPAFDIAGLQSACDDHGASNDGRRRLSKATTAFGIARRALESACARDMRAEEDFTRAFEAWSNHEEELAAAIAKLEIDNARLRQAVAELTSARSA